MLKKQTLTQLFKALSLGALILNFNSNLCAKSSGTHEHFYLKPNLHSLKAPTLQKAKRRLKFLMPLQSQPKGFFSKHRRLICSSAIVGVIGVSVYAFFRYQKRAELNRQLSQAISNQDLKQIQDLIAQGANPNCTNELGIPLTLIALDENDSTLFELLLKKGADVEARHPTEQVSLLFVAIACKEDKLAKLLLQKGASLNFLKASDKFILKLSEDKKDEFYQAFSNVLQEILSRDDNNEMKHLILKAAKKSGVNFDELPGGPWPKA